jgi:hypothetical protein
MNNINLLPKVPAIQRAFAPTLLVIVFLFMMTGSMIYFYSFHVRSDVIKIQAQAASDQAIVKQLIQARQVDPLTKDYQAFAAEIAKLKNARRDWIAVVETISGQLPKNSRMLNLSAEDSAKLSGNYEFAGIADAAEYMLALQHNSQVAGVAVKGITRVEKVIIPTVKPADSKAPEVKSPGTVRMYPTPDIEKPTASKEDEAAIDSVDEMIKMMEQGLVQGKSESDKLLNQLTWMVNQQLVKERFGVDIKDEATLNTLKAKQAANKQQATKPASSTNTPSVDLPSGVGPSDQGSESVAGTTASSNKAITVFQVALNFTLKPPGQTK